MSKYPSRAGNIRPSQLMFTFGVGAIIDLPKLSVIVTGLEDWPTNLQYVQPVVEDRLLMAVRSQLPEVNRLLSPPVVRETGLPVDPFDSTARIGVPVAAFPRWMVCPICRLLAPLSSGLFQLKENPFYPDRTVYRHENCPKGTKPEVFPARFLVACEKGHLDDFPWVFFAHQGESCASPLLRLIEYGASGEARDLKVRCNTCGAKRRLSEAFGRENREKLPLCRGRRPHLRDYDPEECEHRMRPIVLGASNIPHLCHSPISLAVRTALISIGRLKQYYEGDHGTQLTGPNGVAHDRVVPQHRINGAPSISGQNRTVSSVFRDDIVVQAMTTVVIDVHAIVSITSDGIAVKGQVAAVPGIHSREVIAGVVVPESGVPAPGHAHSPEAVAGDVVVLEGGVMAPRSFSSSVDSYSSTSYMPA